MNSQRKFFFIDGYLIKASWRSPSNSVLEAEQAEMHFVEAESEWETLEFVDGGSHAIFHIEVEQVAPGTVLLLRS